MTSTMKPTGGAKLPSSVPAEKLKVPIRARYDNWIGGE